MKQYLAYYLLTCAAVMAMAPQQADAQRQWQQLGRGVVAARNGNNVTVTWRRLAQEPEDATYNVYVKRSGGTFSKINAQPLTNTNYRTTSTQVPTGAEVAVSIIRNGEESPLSVPFTAKAFDTRNMFVDINFQQGGSPLASAEYNTAYVWPCDLDGDGEMDYVVNRKSNTNALDSYVEAYLRTGQHLWTVKLGPNELSCAGQDDQITACDIDCDGLGEVIIQSSDGTQFWNPDTRSFGLYVNGSASPDTDGDGIIDYETQNVRNAPRYISVIDGMTGREQASVEQTYNTHYNRTNRAQLMGDEYNKHVGHMGVFFHDGIHPAVVMEWHMRGTGGDHHYYNLGVGYDFNNGKAGTLKVLFNEPTGAPAFHQIRVGDVDGDGCDEMMVGGYTMDNTGRVLFNTGIAHGDRFRISDIDPERPGLETFAIQQYAPDMLGQILYDARTGEPIKKWYLSAVGDIGRGECMDIDKNHLGWEMWSTMDDKVYDAQGNLITEYSNQYPCEGIWWDDQPDREVVQSSDSHYNVYVQDFFNGREIEIAKISGYRYTTVYAKRAAFWGDIIGDWREELILLHKENGVIVGITGFTTDYATSINNVYCLQEDPHYRGDCSTKGYYQSPNPGFYLGYDMPRPQLPPCMVTDLVARPDGTFTTYQRTPAADTSVEGKSLLLDLTYGSAAYRLSEAVRPAVVYAMPVSGQVITMEGEGSLAGTMDLWKGGQGMLTANVPLAYSGKTYITEGAIAANTTIAGDVQLRARGTLAGNAIVQGQLICEGALNYEGCRLMPGTADGMGRITLKQGLTLNGRLFAEMNIRDAQSQTDTLNTDRIVVEGNVNLTGGTLIFNIKAASAKPAPGRYKLLEYTGQLQGNVNKVQLMGLVGIACQVKNEDHALWLEINEQRQPSDGVRWTGVESGTWDYQTENFTLDGQQTTFVAGDEVSIGDDAQNATITLGELMPLKSLTFDNETKAITLQGDGGISGPCRLVKNGNGRVNLNCTASNFTGPVIINEGTVSVKELADATMPSSLGSAAATSGNLQMGHATLIVDNKNTFTNRILTLNDTATIQIASGTVALKGLINGNGRLVKTGAGQLNITYGGANTWKGGTELKGGTLAQGTWNSTFGPVGSRIDVTGNSAITIFDNNSTSTVPTLNNTINIAAGKTLTVNGGQRCTVRGSVSGEGTMKISFPYVRGDFEPNMTQFAGTLNPTSGQMRLSSTLVMEQGTYQPGAGVYTAHVSGGGSSETQRTSKIGALTSSAADASFGTGTWNVGYLGSSTTFAGSFNSNATLNKYGEGRLTLTGSSQAKMTVHQGTLAVDNTSVATTTGLITVMQGATLSGNGMAASVTVNKGGMLEAGKNAYSVGTLTLTGSLTLKDSAVVIVRGTGTAARADQYKVSGNVNMQNPHFLMSRITREWLPDTEYKVFNVSGNITLTGTPTFEPAVPAEGYVWDYSSLATDGVLRIVADETAVHGIADDNADDGNYYDLLGRKLNQKPRKGLYIHNGKITE